MSIDVLIVGAGPVGLNLAVCLSNLGISYRIIDKKAGLSTTSNAIGVNPRTLETWQTIGFVKDALARGIKLNAASWLDSSKFLNKAKFSYLKSKYDFILSLPQSHTEHLLNEQIEKYDAKVEWNTTLESLVDNDSGVISTCKNPNGTEVIDSKWVVACDGYKSSVRDAAKIERTCHDLAQHFVMIDATLKGDIAKDELSISFSRDGVLFFFPMTDSMRVVAEISSDSEYHDVKTVDKDLFNAIFTRRFPTLSVDRLDWSSSFYVHECIAKNYYKGHIILCGDAAHTHSPAGGQGMNTGIQDTWNLAWKLAHVIRGEADIKLLKTYHDERQEIGNDVLKRSGKITEVGTTTSKLVQKLRNFAIKHLFGRAKVASNFVNSIGQTDICYTNSTLINTKQVKELKNLRYQANKIEWLLLGKTRAKPPILPKFIKAKQVKDLTLLGGHEFCLVRPDGYIAMYANTPEEIKMFLISNGFNLN